MASKPPSKSRESEALFLLTTDWIPENQVKAVEKELGLHLRRVLFNMNSETRKTFNVKTSSEARKKQ